MTPEHMYVFTKDLISGNLWRCLPVINVDRVKDIPCDYPGAMGVPITYLDHHNSERFEILGVRGHLKMEGGRHPYQRIIIRNLHPALPEVIDLAEWLRRTGVMFDVEDMSTAAPDERIEVIYRDRKGDTP